MIVSRKRSRKEKMVLRNRCFSHILYTPRPRRDIAVILQFKVDFTNQIIDVGFQEMGAFELDDGALLGLSEIAVRPDQLPCEVKELKAILHIADACEHFIDILGIRDVVFEGCGLLRVKLISSRTLAIYSISPSARILSAWAMANRVRHIKTGCP